MSTSAEYKWHVELIQDRHQYLSLTYEQAEQIYLHEQNTRIHDIHYFSPWEEWDYEESVFRDILNDDQFIIYKARFEDAIERHNNILMDGDKEQIPTINYYTEIIDYYEQILLPSVFGDPSYQHLGLFREIASKIDYQKAEYKKFLAEYRREIIISHFRHNKSFCPNKLKSQLLAHKLLYLLPEVFSFKGKMDVATAGVVAFVKEKTYLLSDKAYNSWKTKLEESVRFKRSLHKKYYPEPCGWIIYGEMPPEEEKKENILSLLLLDKDKYGWNPSLLR